MWGWEKGKMRREERERRKWEERRGTRRKRGRTRGFRYCFGGARRLSLVMISLPHGWLGHSKKTIPSSHGSLCVCVCAWGGLLPKRSIDSLLRTSELLFISSSLFLPLFCFSVSVLCSFGFSVSVSSPPPLYSTSVSLYFSFIVYGCLFKPGWMANESGCVVLGHGVGLILSPAMDRVGLVYDSELVSLQRGALCTEP